MRARLIQDAAPPPHPVDHDPDRQALEALVVDNADLERLESLIAQFNIFEAVGVERQELRHSDFLSFLLDPRQSHGLGDSFLRRLLQRRLATTCLTHVCTRWWRGLDPLDHLL
jgi:hypothetical protein